MDGKRFDAFSRQLAMGRSRRDLLRSLLLGVAGVTALGLGGIERAKADDETPPADVPESPTPTPTEASATAPDAPPANPPSEPTDVPANGAGDPPEQPTPSPTPESDGSQGDDGNTSRGDRYSRGPQGSRFVCELRWLPGLQRRRLHGLRRTGSAIPRCEDGSCAECCGDFDCFNGGGLCVSGTCVKADCDECPGDTACCTVATLRELLCRFGLRRLSLL